MRTLAALLLTLIEIYQWHECATILYQIAPVGRLDPVDVELFQPGYQRQWNGFRFGRAGAEQQEGDHLLSVMDIQGYLAFFLLNGFIDNMAANSLGDAVRIDNHDHATIAEDCVAREHRNVAQHCRHRFDDDFLGMEDTVDDNTKCLIADLHDDNEAIVVFHHVIADRLSVDPQEVREVNQRQQFLAQTQYRGFLEAFNAMFGI